MPLDSYNLYCGSELVKSIPPDGSGYEVVLENVVAGYPSYSIEAVYRNTDGKTVASPKSAEVKVAVAADFSASARDIPITLSKETIGPRLPITVLSAM